MKFQFKHILNSESEVNRLQGLFDNLNADLKKASLASIGSLDDLIFEIPSVCLADIADKQILVYSSFKNKQIAELNEKLRKLRQRLKSDNSSELRKRIVLIIKKLKGLSQAYFIVQRLIIKSAKKSLLKLLSRNLRLQFRKIIQFHFKNLDDESNSDVLNSNFRDLRFITIRKIYYEIQGKGDYRYQRYHLF